MISPLAQRQIHLASNMEALRQAHDAAEVQQREISRKRAADDKLAEAQTEVPMISEAEGLRTEMRQGREPGQGFPGGSNEELPPEGEGEPGVDESANPADKHLDFLA